MSTWFFTVHCRQQPGHYGTDWRECRERKEIRCDPTAYLSQAHTNTLTGGNDRDRI